MKYYLILFALILPIILAESSDDYSNEDLLELFERDFSASNPLKFLGKCLTDSECKKQEYCDHHRFGFGECKIGKENSNACVFDRHCKSKVCHHLKCVAKKPVKDGPCTKDQHNECIPEQYCHHEKKDIYVCINRKCSGLCSKNEHCLSSKCDLFHCKKPANGCTTR